MGCFGSRKSSPHPTVMFVIGGPGSGKELNELIRIDAMKGKDEIFEEVKVKMIEKKLN